MKNYLIVSLFCFINLFLSTSFAAGLHLPVGMETGSIYCNATDPTATVNIDASDVQVKGFCESNPYVVFRGHIRNLPVSALQHYFEIKKDPTAHSEIIVSVSSGSIRCDTGSGEKRTAYGAGIYC